MPVGRRSQRQLVRMRAAAFPKALREIDSYKIPNHEEYDPCSSQAFTSTDSIGKSIGMSTAYAIS
jgi:hypothetical protein